MGFTDKHLLGIEPLSPVAISEILDLADSYADLNRRSDKHSNVLAGLTQINMFFKTRRARKPLLKSPVSVLGRMS